MYEYISKQRGFSKKFLVVYEKIYYTAKGSVIYMHIFKALTDMYMTEFLHLFYLSNVQQALS